MDFLCFVGRLLFVSLFLFSAWQEMTILQIKFLVAGAIAIKALGSLLFILDNTWGATLLILHQLIATPILYDSYISDIEKNEFFQRTFKLIQRLSLLGGLLLFIGMKNSIPKTDGNVRDAYINHMKDQLLRERVEREILMEELNDTQTVKYDVRNVHKQNYPNVIRKPSRGGSVQEWYQ